MSEISHCPFCGSINTVVSSDPVDALTMSVVCCDCGAHGPSVKAPMKEVKQARQSAIELWNMRDEHYPGDIQSGVIRVAK